MSVAASLARLDRAEASSALQAFEAARDAGYGVELEVDNRLVLVASREFPGAEFNQADGLTQFPELLTVATDFFDLHRTPGWLRMTEPPWAGAESDYELSIYATDPREVAEARPPNGVTIRQISRDDIESFICVPNDPAGPDWVGPNPWPDIYRGLAIAPGRHLLLAELRGAPIARASVSIHDGVGWLRTMLVAPEFRGRGLQRALIAARARLAADLGCDLLGAAAAPGWISADNLEHMGMTLVGTRQHYVYMPAMVTA